MQIYSYAGQTNFYKGKVRDVYTISDKYIAMIASDRISAFDVVLPHPIPFKGQVLNQIASVMLHATRDICPNWLMDVPAPNASVGLKCIPLKIEMVVRGNVTGHAWRTYSSGKRKLCGINLSEGLRENDFFPEPIITPSTKADHGHDEDISKEDILKTELATSAEWETIETYALQLFARGKKLALEQGLILADTKYEFGKIDDTVYLMDEIHTPDSSRYFYADGFDERQNAGQKQKQLSKEFVREWLISHDFMGKQNQVVPEMNAEWITTISNRYIELYEKLIGEKFQPVESNPDKTYQLVANALQNLQTIEP